MYWTDSGPDKIQRANLDGSNIEDLVKLGYRLYGGPRGIALDVEGGKMYWIDVYTNKIQRANLDGSNIEDLVTQGLKGPRWHSVRCGSRQDVLGKLGHGENPTCELGWIKH